MRLNGIVSIFVIITTEFVRADAQRKLALKKCFLDDPDLDRCLTEATRSAIPKIYKGIPSIGLKSLDPLRNVSFRMSTSPNGPVVATIVAKNVSISGTSKLLIRRVFYDASKSSIVIEGHHGPLRMTGNYWVKGSILNVPIVSSGEFDHRFLGLEASHSVQLGNTLRDLSHGKVRFEIKDLKGMKFYMKDSRLPESASNLLNKLVNDNSAVISNTTKALMENIVNTISTEALRPLTSKYTVAELLPLKRGGLETIYV